MAKFTKGEWFPTGTLVEHASNNVADICICDPEMFGQEHIGRSCEETYANAQLIAAAPRMFKALKKAIKDYGKPGGPCNVPNQPGTWIAMAEAAIDAAEGK